MGIMVYFLIMGNAGIISSTVGPKPYTPNPKSEYPTPQTLGPKP